MTPWSAAAACLVALVAGTGCSERPPDQRSGAAFTPPLAPRSLADRAAWRAFLHWPDECEDAFQASRAGDDAGVAVQARGDSVSRVLVLCAAGAYQPSSMLWRVDGRRSPPGVELLALPVYQSADGTALVRSETTELWGEVAFEPPADEVTILSLARQTGDCGTWSRYSLAGGMPRLLEVWARLPCPPEPGVSAEPAAGAPPQGWTRIQLE